MFIVSLSGANRQITQNTYDMLLAKNNKKGIRGIHHTNFMNFEEYKAVKALQDDQLTHIEQSCAEHAIISLVTAFETYYKELVQQLLADYPAYFVGRDSAYSDAVKELIEADQLFGYEDVAKKLRFTSRRTYYNFFDAFSIPFLPESEREIIEHLCLRRNNYVHNAGRPDSEFKKKIIRHPRPLNEDVLSTESKRMRTKMKKILVKSYERVIAHVQK